MKRPPRVTDHAVLRYLQRAKGYDIERVREEIARQCAPALAAGAASLVAEGVKFEFAGGAVVTVVPNTGLPNRTHEERLARGAGAVKAVRR